MHYEIDEAANHVTNFLGTCYILSMVMACFVDVYIGRFRTVLIAPCYILICSFSYTFFSSSYCYNSC
ncbi:putative proton-dependent oligopeptide transporter family [Helianthus anomalus]